MRHAVTHRFLSGPSTTANVPWSTILLTNRPAKITESKDQHLSLAGSFGDAGIVGRLERSGGQCVVIVFTPGIDFSRMPVGWLETVAISQKME